MAPRLVRFGVRSRKLSNGGRSLDGLPKICCLELFRASEGTLSRWPWLHLHTLATTNPHWACVVGYGLFVIHKEGLCPGSGDINRLILIKRRRLRGISTTSSGIKREWWVCECVYAFFANTYILHIENTQAQSNLTFSCTQMFILCGNRTRDLLRNRRVFGLLRQ
jgi:hypothetical protein